MVNLTERQVCDILSDLAILAREADDVQISFIDTAGHPHPAAASSSVVKGVEVVADGYTFEKELDFNSLLRVEGALTNLVEEICDKVPAFENINPVHSVSAMVDRALVNNIEKEIATFAPENTLNCVVAEITANPNSIIHANENKYKILGTEGGVISIFEAEGNEPAEVRTAAIDSLADIFADNRDLAMEYKVDLLKDGRLPSVEQVRLIETARDMGYDATISADEISICSGKANITTIPVDINFDNRDLYDVICEAIDYDTAMTLGLNAPANEYNGVQRARNFEILKDEYVIMKALGFDPGFDPQLDVAREIAQKALNTGIVRQETIVEELAHFYIDNPEHAVMIQGSMLHTQHRREEQIKEIVDKYAAIEPAEGLRFSIPIVDYVAPVEGLLNAPGGAAPFNNVAVTFELNHPDFGTGVAVSSTFCTGEEFSMRAPSEADIRDIAKHTHPYDFESAVSRGIEAQTSAIIKKAVNLKVEIVNGVELG